MPWYRTGTVAITAGQTTVTGTGTAFSANARVGDAFQGPDGRWYEVTNIASATVLSILPAYQGVTVAGGSYALAPMQGYVKESADRLRQIVNDWGSTLAGLGSVSTENVVPVTKGGTGGTTPASARGGLGLKSAAIADIVGIVSQSGGVPTGAILESGENVNGKYMKFADGTMVATSREIYNGSAIGNAGGAVYFGGAAPARSFPILFADNPVVTQQFEIEGTAAVWSASTGLSAPGWWASCYPFSSVARPSVNLVLHRIAIGRWY